jgi:hypothetical protein
LTEIAKARFAKGLLVRVTRYSSAWVEGMNKFDLPWDKLMSRVKIINTAREGSTVYQRPRWVRISD